MPAILHATVPLDGKEALEKERAISAADMQAFGEIPVQEEGRIKPLETFARMQLQAMYGKMALPDYSALQWLAELLFTPDAARKRPVFAVVSRDVVTALSLPSRTPRLYSFAEVAPQLFSRQEMILPLLQKKESELTIAQEHLLQLYSNVMRYIDLTESFGFLLPRFVMDDAEVAAWLEVAPGSRLSLLELRHQAMRMGKFMEDAPADPLTQRLGRLIMAMQQTERVLGVNGLHIVPPQWEEDEGRWFAPWGILLEGRGSPRSAEYVEQWQELALAWRAQNATRWLAQSHKIRETMYASGIPGVSADLLALEARYYRLDMFGKSLYAYLTGFLLALAALLWKPGWLRTFGLVAVVSGVVLHASGIVMRMLIMSRPPVSTLYESIIFVGLIAVLFGLILEWRKGNRIGLLVAALAGSVLQLLGTRYAADGDTMKVLVAVLNTNFWLATHVVVITIGYGACLLAGTLAHGYLLFRLLRPGDVVRHQELHRNIRGVAMVALLFATLGTILGGIWADQSWGRFWGWDPKENGALLIVLWLLFLMHGRLAGYFRDIAYAAGMVLTNMIVALAWFGVNLLNVGLHSYGFTRNIAVNLGLFCAAELLFAAIVAGMIYLRERQKLPGSDANAH